MDWSSLPIDLWGCVAGRLTMIEDFKAFRGVCTDWRSLATKDKFLPVSKGPLLMLSEKDGSDERELYSLSKREICTRIPFPGGRGKRCVGVGFGWVLAMSESGEACLLKLFSYARIQLPSYQTCLEDDGPYFLYRAWLTADPSDASNFKLLVFVNYDLGFWTRGDEEWRMIESEGTPTLTCCQGKIYSVDCYGNVLIWDDPLGTDLTKPQGLTVQVDNAPTTQFATSWFDYLVMSSAGELMIITRFNGHHFRVMRVDLVKGEYKEIHDLGNDAIFLGNNAAVAVDATRFPGVLKSNCIYFTNDSYESGASHRPIHMGIYSVEDQGIERFEVESFNSNVSPNQFLFSLSMV